MQDFKINSFVVCIDNKNYPASLELLKIYPRLYDSKAESNGYLRIIDESGEDYIYAEELFKPIEVPINLRRIFKSKIAVSN